MSVCTDSLFQRLVSVSMNQSNQTSCQETIKHNKVHPSRCLPLLEGSPPACRLRLFLYCTYCVRLYKACCCVTSCPWTLTYEDDETERLAALKRLLPTPPPSPTSDLWPLNSELWSLESLQWFNKRLSGSRGNLASQKSSLTSYMDVKIRTELLFLRSVFVSSAFKDYSDLWQLGFHFCSFGNQDVNGLNLGTQKQLKGSRKMKLLLLLLKVCSELGPVWKIRKIAKSEEIRGVDLHHVTWLMSPASLMWRQVTRVNVVILTKVWSCACVSRKSLLPRFNQSVSGAGSVLVPPLELNDVI